ncbi:MarR family transcriptional regulator, partial [Candidatus Woesearchaeota archaeon]|nr:MarR family transcriptional regulator [Candidatus Woesearchaeota archaeon]
LSKLDEDEKKIYELLKKSNGSVYQTDIIKETGYSKVKITRILDKMELAQIVERKRRGMTNIIVLK